jgi:uncharacterized MAPEG superfamily protein
MTIAYWCVLLAAIMPILTVAFAKFGHPNFDNTEPRTWLEKQSGLRRRADHAHRNHFEAFPFFAVSVIISQQLHAAQNILNLLAVVFIISRIAYTIFYLKNFPVLRSITWSIAFLSIVAILVLGGLN